jgi:hypothetical protein
VLSVLHLNVHGLLSRDALAVMQAIQGADYDVLVFTETWLRWDADAPELPGFTSSLNLPRSRRLQRGTVKGGIAVYVADALAPSVTVLSTGLLNAYALLRLVGCVGQGEDAYMFACYMPPERSPALDGKGAAVWEALREEVGDTMRLGHVFVIGDLNARTATCPDFPGTISHPIREPFQSTGARPARSQRHSRDTLERPNPWGWKLLDLCISTSMRIANGRVLGDEQGQITFVSQSGEGSSLIDYVLASPDAMLLTQSLQVLPAPESDHMALRLRIARSTAASPAQARRRPRSRPAAPLGVEEREKWKNLKPEGWL